MFKPALKIKRQGNTHQKLSLASIAISAVLLAACGDDSYSVSNEAVVEPSLQPKQETSFTVDQVKANYVAMAYAAYSDSLQAAKLLQSSVNAFVANPTEANLLMAKAAYKSARAPYQQSEIMRWDTSITLDKDLTADGGLASVDEWEGQVNAWPLDENHIDSIIAGTDTINVDLLLSQNGANDNEANVTTGVHAIEYMLWGADTHGTDAGAGERPASDFDTTACSDSLCQRRVDYLVAATDLLVDDLTAMNAEWSPQAAVTVGTLAYNFSQSEMALDYIFGSLISMAAEELAGARMNSGLLLGDPEEEHDCFSDLSHIAIYHNFQGVKNAFYGSYQGVDGPGVGDLVKAADAATYNKIDAMLTSIEGHMSQIMSFGEREENPIKFDQIIGQADTDAERAVALMAVDELIALDAEFRIAAEALSIDSGTIGGGGD